MDEDVAFDEFYAKLKDIVNYAFNLGEKIPEPKIVRKILRSLQERFHAKITAIEESKDVDTIPLMELIGNLQTYGLGYVFQWSCDDTVDIVFCLPSICVLDPEKSKNIIFSPWGRENI